MKNETFSKCININQCYIVIYAFSMVFSFDSTTYCTYYDSTGMAMQELVNPGGCASSSTLTPGVAVTQAMVDEYTSSGCDWGDSTTVNSIIPGQGHLTKLNINDPLLDIAKELEQSALNDEYFVQRKLYPNVDFYSGIIYRAMGIPTNMFTVMFALGRLPGWLAHWKEMVSSPDFRINRPRQIYTGKTKTHFK